MSFQIQMSFLRSGAFRLQEEHDESIKYVVQKIYFKTSEAIQQLFVRKKDLVPMAPFMNVNGFMNESFFSVRSFL